MKLTPAEREVVDLLARGLSYKEIAHKLGKRPGTVSTQVHSARSRIGARTAIELVVLAVKDDAEPT